MSIRCKFKCESETISGDNNDFSYSYKFRPVTSGSKENEEFYKWTPGGELWFSILRKAEFIPGNQYYIDISEAQ